MGRWTLDLKCAGPLPSQQSGHRAFKRATRPALRVDASRESPPVYDLARAIELGPCSDESITRDVAVAVRASPASRSAPTRSKKAQARRVDESTTHWT